MCQHQLVVLIQNLQKREGLATELQTKYHPDILLLQEINLSTETHPLFASTASNVSSLGYGTAIGSDKFQLHSIRKVQSPHSEIGGFIRKKTTIATIKNIQFVSFHGYNGQPFKSVEKLVAHVYTVLSVLTPGPALFAGDFNTWSKEHVMAVRRVMHDAGFGVLYSWPYPGREQELDHAFARGLRIIGSENYECESDHRGAIVEVEVEQ